MKSKRPDSIEIFIDRALGRRIAESLIEAGAIVHLHDDYFAQGVEDEVWLTKVGEFGWVVLTKDKHIRYRTIEREALMNARVKAFIFMSGNVSFSDMTQIVAKALPAIERFTHTHPAPFIAGIYKDASVKMILGI
ncbi:MAG: hypothetical protein IT171_05820 [Acidobacteria bacterium]|nr:hypothetical protein [Acidobacteriota bacterium]